MTYRDDHDAAIARIDALQADLARSEAERDRLKAALDRRVEPAPATPVTALVHQRMMVREIDALVDNVHEAALRTSRSRRLSFVASGAAASILFIVGIAAAQPWCFVAAIVAMIGAALRAVMTNEDEAVIDAIRHAPERIVDITRLSSRNQLAQRLLIRTTDSQVVLRGPNLYELQEQLLRRRLDGILTKSGQE